MEIGTALAVVAFADQCLKYGKKFVKRCQTYLHAEEETAELLLAIESNWTKMETQMELLKKIAGSLSKKLQDMQARVLSQLEGKLKTATLIIDELLKEKRKITKEDTPQHDDPDFANLAKRLRNMGASKKAKYVLKKSSLCQIIDDIEKWQARYDPSWFLIMQRPISGIDERLDEQEKKPESQQVSVIAVAKGIRGAARAARDENFKGQGPIWIDRLDMDPFKIPRSSVQLSTLQDTKEMVIIDMMITNPAANSKQTLKEVRNMARILAEVDPSIFGLLKCRGVIKVEGSKKSVLSATPLVDFKFIFNIPPDLSNPRSLRDILMSKSRYPLNERLNLAKRLASSILFVHTVRFVHKNIRPETIIVFRNEHSDIGAPFLVGFEQFRLEDGMTYRVGDDAWERNFCKSSRNPALTMLTSPVDRHPSRQGTHPEMDYQMQHDIYSLGVVLLEIGLWDSFVLYGQSEDISSPVRNEILGSVDKAQPQKSRGIAYRNKLNLEDLATRELPSLLGQRYTDVVLSCLRCLDPRVGDNGEKGFGADDGDEMDEDGVAIGVSYIENVLEKLEDIVV